ncbi:MAG TPA: hypothetical protein PLP43_05255 [Methanoculleus sp.]|nr:hypothetical protein [Methanoculleus sp.]
MTDGSEIKGLLDSLERLIGEAERRNRTWKEVWNEIKSINQAFKGSKFPTVRKRQAAWDRFQTIIAEVKASQERAKEEFTARVSESNSHLSEILSLARRATPSSESDDVFLALITGGLSIVITQVLDAILGPFDDRKFELIACSKTMGEGWAYLSRNKGRMSGRDKQEAFEALTRASEALNVAWDEWKRARSAVIERYHAEKQAAWETRQARRREAIAKKEAWEERTRENIANLTDRLDSLESALDRRQRNLSKLEEMRDSAWSDSYRDRVEGWIDEENERISDIQSTIDRVKGWIAEMEAKLR